MIPFIQKAIGEGGNTSPSFNAPLTTTLIPFSANRNPKVLV